MTASPNLALPYLEAAQAQKHVTVNEALRLLDALVHLSVASATTTAPPGAPANGVAYIVPAGATGAWSGWAGSIAFYADTAWLRILPKEGMLAWVRDTDMVVVYGGSSWAGLKADGERYWGRLAADRTLTGTTTAQKLFDFGGGGGGALTLAAGHYAIRAVYWITGMDAASGNAGFSLAGTATLSEVLQHAVGRDVTNPASAGAFGGSGALSAAFSGDVVTASTGTAMLAMITGSFKVAAAGTVIPSIALTTAIAATVKAGSHVVVERLGDTSANWAGDWA